MKKIKNTLGVEVNYQDFNLVVDPNNPFENYGWTKEDVEEMLYIEEYELEDEDVQNDSELFNNLGILYSDAVGVERNMEKAIKYFEHSVSLDDDLARSNLADIYRKGMWGVDQNLKRAFELYKECKLPYAYYRVGEAYEYGRGVEQDVDAAKFNYRVAYKAGHPLARKKLKTFDFLR